MKSKMKPSTELDALVATKVLGLHEEAGWWKNDAGEIRYAACTGCMGESTWSPSTDIAAAWEVDRPSWLWQFQETGEMLTVRLYKSLEILLEYFGNYQLNTEEIIMVRREWLCNKARTYAWLRCLAALKAVGVEVEDA